MANFVLFHGIFLWFTWSVLAIAQVSVNRYLKGAYWMYSMWLHRIIGSVMLVSTLAFVLFELVNKGWSITVNLHLFTTLPVFFLVLFIFFTPRIIRRSSTILNNHLPRNHSLYNPTSLTPDIVINKPRQSYYK